MTEEKKFMVEEVDAVETPPKARVEEAEAAPRQRDYLDGFLAQSPAKSRPASRAAISMTASSMR